MSNIVTSISGTPMRDLQEVINNCFRDTSKDGFGRPFLFFSIKINGERFYIRRHWTNPGYCFFIYDSEEDFDNQSLPIGYIETDSMPETPLSDRIHMFPGRDE